MRIRTLFTLLTVFSLTINARAQTPKWFIDTIKTDLINYQSVYSGYPERQQHEGSIEPDSVMRAERISKKGYAALVRTLPKTIVNDTSTIIRKKKSFVISNGHFKKTFVDNDKTSPWYMGFIASLNLYIIHTVYPFQEISGVELIDYRTGRAYDIPACADQGPQDILLSPKQQTLLVYSSSDWNEGECTIYLMKIKRDTKKQQYALKGHLALNFCRMNIQKLSWVNEQSFVMAVTERDEVEDTGNHVYGEQRKYYMKVTLLK